mgnify:CR=1 FL=1
MLSIEAVMLMALRKFILACKGHMSGWSWPASAIVPITENRSHWFRARFENALCICDWFRALLSPRTFNRELFL